MPLTIPAIDDRRYQDLRDDALARIPVHNPEWTNFNRSDPGVTLVELFAFMTESLLYRANQIPERNRVKFLKLLGIHLQPATAAQGIVAFSNERGPLETTTLHAGFELRAGRIEFRIQQGLDVLPIEGRVYYKREVPDAGPEVRAYYDQLYASFLKPPLPLAARLYESVPLDRAEGHDLAHDTVDSAFWMALLARKDDVAGLSGDALERRLDEIRGKIATKTLTLGVVPWLADAEAHLTPAGTADPERALQLVCQIPVVPEGGRLPAAASERVPSYRQLTVVGGDVLSRPGTVQIPLPDKTGLGLWTNLEPLEAGVGDFPPAISDTNVESRVITWLRLSVPPRTPAKILWAGINAAMVAQRARIVAERLPAGTGAPDQTARLAHRPVLPDSIRLLVTRPGSTEPEEWTPVDDLANAGPEVPVAQPGVLPAVKKPKASGETCPNDGQKDALAAAKASRRFMADAEAGELRFGDGLRGARPPLGATMTVDYEYSEGVEGNVNAGAIKTGPSLAPGFSVTNPVPTWCGGDAETVAQGEKQVQRWLQHRDRLVTASDFEAITWRTPGVDMGRVDVIPAASPEFGDNEPGDAPGAVTLILVPRHDPDQPDAPRPDRLFLETVCEWLDPRRLVTTEVFLRGPVYKKVWLSVGIDVAIERSIAEVRQAVERALRATLAPLPPADADVGPDDVMPLLTSATPRPRGWPLRKPVVALELAAVVARVPGVTAVREFLLAGDDDTTPQPSVDMKGLELPRIGAIAVSIGPAQSIGDLRGQPGTGAAGPVGFVPVPVVPEEC
jgi:hypothetical protein